MHASCPQETLLYLRILRAFVEVLTPLKFIKISGVCRDNLRHKFFVLVHPCVPLYRSVRIDCLTWMEISEDANGVTDVALDFQILQIQQLAFVNDPGTRFKFAAKTSAYVIMPQACTDKKNFIELIEILQSKLRYFF